MPTESEIQLEIERMREETARQLGGFALAGTFITSLGGVLTSAVTGSPSSTIGSGVGELPNLEIIPTERSLSKMLVPIAVVGGGLATMTLLAIQLFRKR